MLEALYKFTRKDQISCVDSDSRQFIGGIIDYIKNYKVFQCQVYRFSDRLKEIDTVKQAEEEWI